MPVKEFIKPDLFRCGMVGSTQWLSGEMVSSMLGHGYRHCRWLRKFFLRAHRTAAHLPIEQILIERIL